MFSKRFVIFCFDNLTKLLRGTLLKRLISLQRPLIRNTHFSPWAATAVFSFV